MGTQSRTYDAGYTNPQSTQLSAGTPNASTCTNGKAATHAACNTKGDTICAFGEAGYTRQPRNGPPAATRNTLPTAARNTSPAAARNTRPTAATPQIALPRYSSLRRRSNPLQRRPNSLQLGLPRSISLQRRSNAPHAVCDTKGDTICAFCEAGYTNPQLTQSSTGTTNTSTGTIGNATVSTAYNTDGDTFCGFCDAEYTKPRFAPPHPNLLRHHFNPLRRRLNSPQRPPIRPIPPQRRS